MATFDLQEFVQRLQDTNDEHWDHSCKCYELALRQIRMQLSWTPHSRRVVIMVGDSRPHDTSYRLNVDKIDWRNELLFLHQDMVCGQECCFIVVSLLS